MSAQALVGVLLAALTSTSPLGAQLSEPLAPCSLEGVDAPARCGRLTVPENPDRPEGRHIDLRVTVLPGEEVSPGAPPLAVLAGGPGQAATALADFAAQAFAGIRAERNILLVDARGTGGSNSLDCPDFARPDGPADVLGELFDAERVTECRASLSQKAELSMYTTERIAGDMVRVWDALGHDQVDLYGTSYGTRLALELMRSHPDRIRSAILKGVAPMELRMPLNYPRDGQSALDRIFEHCRAETACVEAYPALDVDLRNVLQALDQGVEVSLANPAGGDTTTVELGRAPVVQAMMAGLQSTPLAVRLPRMIHAAARGSWEPLASLAVFYRMALARELHEGMFLSVTCAEDLPFIDGEVAARVAEDTFLGLSRYSVQAAACEWWNVPAVDAAFREPVNSSVPTLVISGNYDPVTPPRWGWRVADRLESAHHVVVPEGSHSFAGMQGCVDVIMARFILAGSAEDLPEACVNGVELGAFALPGDPWLPFLQAPSEPLAGG